MQTGGNRARFFAPQAVKSPGASAVSRNPESTGDGSLMPSSSKDSESIASGFDTGCNTTTSSGTLVSFPKQILLNETSTLHRPASDSSGGDTIAQRTRIIETEPVFKANREGHGKLNLSGLIKHVDVNTVKAAHQSASVKEVVDNEDLGTRSPHQYSGSKLISKSNTPSYASASPHFTPLPSAAHRSSCNMPPSNQLASQAFKVPPHHTPRSAVAMDSSPMLKQTPDPSLAVTNDSHISTRLPTNRSDDSIKSLTSAFNKKHSGVSKNPTSRFPSPVSHHGNSSRNGRAYSPNLSIEDDPPTSTPGTFGPRGLRIESHNFSSEICDDGDFKETSFQGSQRYHASVQEQHGQQEQQEKRGEKRISDSGVDDECVVPPSGKKARIDTYDEVRGQLLQIVVEDHSPSISISCPSTTTPTRP